MALVFSILFFLTGFLPIISNVVKMSCLAFSILLFVVFFLFVLGKNKNKKDASEKECDEAMLLQKVDIGTKETVFFNSFENEEYLKLQWKEKGRKKTICFKRFSLYRREDEGRNKSLYCGYIG